MSALLLKDWYQLSRQSKLTIIMAAVMIFIGVASSSVFYAAIGALLCVMLPMTSLAYDQMHHWDRYVMGLPVTRKDVVLSKYVLAILGILASTVVLMVFGLIMQIRGSIAFDTILSALWTQLAVGLFFLSVNYPIVIKIGFERGRIWYIIITMPIMAFAGLLGNTNVPDRSALAVSSGSFLVLPILMFLVFLSYRLSVRFMERKEY